MATKWDPLKYSLSEEVVGAVTKRQIKNILISYTGWYDPICELLQNALDAVETRRNTLKENAYKPHIEVTIDCKENKISVTDNGIGFNEQQFKSFLAPNVSFKGQEDRGNKGVGATYLAYGFNFLQIGTKTKAYSFVGNIEGGRDWVEDNKGTVTRPEIVESPVIDSQFNNIDIGSTFTLKLGGENVRPKSLKWLGANSIEQWEAVLRLKTPLGGVYMNRPKPDISCKLILINDAGVSTQKEIDCTYYYPHAIITACKDLQSIFKKQKELSEKGRDTSLLPADYQKLNGLYNFWKSDDVINNKNGLQLELDEQEKRLVESFKPSIYGFMCYSTNILDELSDTILKLRKGSRILRGGLQLATNSMPHGEIQVIPLTKNIWYQNVTHVLIHFENADPDLGRKGFQPELESLAQKISGAVVRALLNWKRLFKKEIGPTVSIVEERNINDWIKAQEEHEKQKPLIIKRTDVFLPLCEPAISSEPMNEQDVIALFNQLLAGGVIRGIKIMATDQRQQYDSICRFRLVKPIEHHIFDKKKNPLGIDATNANEFESIPKILEYKYSFDSLIDEFEKEEKTEKNIGLVVAWTIGKNWSKRYEITPLLHLDNLHHRLFHGATHILKNSGTGDEAFPIIILSELIEYLNDIDASQKIQRERYLDI